ncbi:MAG: XdhC family protein [Butyricicoccaceae bacterium]
MVCDLFPAAIEKIGIRESDYVAVITRGHRYDADCLRELLRGIMPRYLGMIGSKRRTVGLLNMLEEEGFSRADLDRIHTPIGLDIGALTVKEIAISIVAELIAERRRTTDRRSKSSILTAEDIDLRCWKPLHAVIFQKRSCSCTTSGSTPVKSGSYMVVDANTATAGTIGGGCSESAVMRQAFYLIGTGEHKCVTIDMSNDIAAQEGMVCGGQMKVLLADLGTKKIDIK